MFNFFRKSPLFIFLPLLVCNGLIVWYLSPVNFFPDEEAHFNYTDHLARTGELPSAQSNVPLRNRTLRLKLDGAANRLEGAYGLSEKILDSSQEPDTPLPHLEIPLYTKPPAYYAIGAFLSNLGVGNGSVLTQFSLLRLYSLALWLITIVLAAGLMRAVFPENLLYQGWGIAMVGLNPMFTFMGSAINPDILGTLIMTAIIWLSLVAIRSPSWRSPAFLSALVLSLVIIAVKPQHVLALAFLLAAFALQQLRHPENRIGKKQLVGIAVLVILVSAGAAIGYFVLFIDYRGAIATAMKGDLSPASWLRYVSYLFKEVFLTPYVVSREGDAPRIFQIYFQYWEYLRPGYFHNYSSLDSFFIFTTKIFVWGGAIGIALKTVSRKLSREEAFLLFVTVAWWFWIVSLTWLLFPRETHMQGRYFFPVIAAAMPLLIAGWSILPFRLGHLAARAMIVFMLIFFEYEVIRLLLYI